MATLANIRGASLAPDFSGFLGALLQNKREAGLDRRQQVAIEAQESQEAAQQRALQQQIGVLTGGSEIPLQPGESGQAVQFTPAATGKARDKALFNLISLDPNVGNSITSLLQSGDAREIAKVQATAELGLRQSKIIQSQDTFAGKQKAITNLANEIVAGELPPEEKAQNLERISGLLNKSPEELDLELLKMDVMGTDLKTLTAPARGAGADFSKAPGVITRDEAGNASFQIPVLDKNTGEFQMKSVRISGEVVSRLGETGVEESLRKAGQAGEAEIQRLSAQLETKPKITAAEKQAAAQVTRTQGIIDRGLTAADSVPILARSLELLESVSTGGFDAASLRARQLFGIEGADEAELSANLGKAVLSQLRTTFGAAFTEGEGDRLIKIEAAFGKSPAGNIRLLKQTKRIAERAANRAIKAAEKSGDTDTADEIREALAFSLSAPDAAVPDAGTAVPTAVNPTTGETLFFRNGQWSTQ